MIDPQPVTPVIVKVVPSAPTPEVSIVDILMGSFGLIGSIVLISAVLGLLVGGGLIAYSRWRTAHSDPSPGGDNTRLDLSSPNK